MAELHARPATLADIDLVHARLGEVIAESEHYNQEFKDYETARLDKRFLRTLIGVDPWHVTLLLIDGTPGGCLISGPEFGAIFRYWSWIFPEHRRTRLGLHGMRVFDEHWDNGRFHKAYTFVRTGNEVALALLRRYGYTETCVLRQHLFGQDYVLVEKPYTKVTEGYDTGLGPGRLGRLRRRLSALVGR